MSDGIELFDSHCHLTSESLLEDRREVLERARSAGVTRLVSIASHVADAREALALARATPGVWSTAGVHPHEAGGAAADAMEEIRALAAEPEVVAVGETGLDYHYDHAPRAVQQHLFDQHLGLGAELDLPVVVHARDADADVAAALRRAPSGVRGVLHCFTGGDAAFEAAMELGWWVSFSGIASFRSFGAVDLLRQVPEDRLLVETDSPYLAPVPRRGKRNEPAFVRHVAEAVARHLDRTLEEVARLTTDNACAFYRVDQGEAEPASPAPAGS